MAKHVNAVSLKGKAFLDRLKIKSILRALGRTPESFLDIGCGDGKYLRALEKLGLSRSRLFGLELDDELVDRLKHEGYNVFSERVEESESIPERSIDLITMFHVIEHVAEPQLVIEKISRWLRPGGILAIETPNLNSIDATWFKETYWGGYHIPRHWTLFDESTLTNMLESAGLKVLGLKYQTGHSFWMWSLHHMLRFDSTFSIDAIGKLFNPMKGLPFLMFFTVLDIVRRSLGFKTSAVLAIAIKTK